MKNIKKLLIVVMLVLTLFSAVGVNNVYADGQDIKNDVCGFVPDEITGLVATIVTIIKIGVPIILIILGMIDMGKAVASQKEDEIKNGQKKLLSRCVAAGITFFVVAIVQLLVNIVTKSNGDSELWNCIARFVGASDNNTVLDNQATGEGKGA